MNPLSDTNSLMFTHETPAAFLCKHSKNIMKDPVLSLCGHLFDRQVLENITKCPIDQSPLNPATVISFLELKTQIEIWKCSAIGSKTIPNSPAKLYPQGIIGKIGGLSLDIEKGAAVPQASSSSQGVEVPLRIENDVRIIATNTIRNAHYDDIHGMILLKNGFATGSKDTTLKMWDWHGKPLPQPRKLREKTGYANWVTALAPLGTDYWASGRRNGEIDIWNSAGELLSSMCYTPGAHDKNAHVSKERNKTRINCITLKEASDENAYFYTGTLTSIQTWDGRNGKIISQHKVHANDWVYCIEQLSNERLLLVIGSSMQIWDFNKSRPTWSEVVQPARQAYGRQQNGIQQRPHISAVKKIEGKENLFAAAVFDGSVRLIDLTAQKELHRYCEHEGRVWMTENLKSNLLASCADDAKIKIWDIRQTKAIHTIAGNLGRVSSLLRLTQETFISGSCPDNVFESKEKAEIQFWDMRMLPS